MSKSSGLRALLVASSKSITSQKKKQNIMVFDKSNTTIFCFFFVHTVGPPYFMERTRMAWNACAKQQASWVCSHNPGLQSTSLLLSLSQRELQCTNQEQKRWGINRSRRTKCATKSRSHTTARSHTHMPCNVSRDPRLSSARCMHWANVPRVLFLRCFSYANISSDTTTIQRGH